MRAIFFAWIAGLFFMRPGRERICIDDGWRFMKYAAAQDSVTYDSVKEWILASGNDFISDPGKRPQRPTHEPAAILPFIQNTFNDSGWALVDLPHDWAIKGPFYAGAQPLVGGGMGRLPSPGVGWYRRKLAIPISDSGRCIYLDIDGAMSYAMVWLNGVLVGGWPYGYNSFRLDLTRYIKFGGDNELAIRLDNPPNSSRWYPGGGIFRNVWLTKVNPVHVGQWGTFIHSRNVSAVSAMVDVDVDIENQSARDQRVDVVTEIYSLGVKVASIHRPGLVILAGHKRRATDSVVVHNPLLWGPPPAQKPNLYTAVSRVYVDGQVADEYATRFGIRSLTFDPVRGLLVNDKPVRIQGVNQHADLGALGMAFNTRAAERQLEILREMGCNAIRTAHNPPAPELLDLTDRMGFLVLDEIFDCWEKGKNPFDFHLIFSDWHEADIRAFMRRDRDHPSVIAWSFGNEVGEQFSGAAGAAVAKGLRAIVHSEDSTRPCTASMNYAKSDMPFPQAMDILGLNYQGEGIRDAPAYAMLKGIATPPAYSSFHEKFPGKMIVSLETASTLSTRGTYLFPVFGGVSAPVSDSAGGDPVKKQVSAYELYTAFFGSSPDKVFAAQDKHPFVAGEFVWSGWDYLGEPTPYYGARSSYSGIIDLAGFKKDRFYLYESRWRPDHPMAHILPHWTWPDRIGKVTPVHVFTSGDEAELFLNGQSLGRKKKGSFEYRLRWDSVVYQPGELKVVAYKNGRVWASDVVKTAGEPAGLRMSSDRGRIKSGGNGLAFIAVRVVDSAGVLVPQDGHAIFFDVSEGGEIVATDNGDPADLTPFPSAERHAFEGLALAIVRARAGYAGKIVVTARIMDTGPGSRYGSGRVVLEAYR